MIERAVRRAIALVASVVVMGMGLAAPASAQLSAQPSTTTVYGMTPKRTVASTAVVVGLASAVIGGLAMVRATRRIGNSGRRGAIVALVLGPIGFMVGWLVVATAKGGVGTGNGVAGGVVAMMVGIIGTACGGLALMRSSRTKN